MQEAKVIVPAVETLVRVEGTVDRPVCHIRFEKITFSYTTWMHLGQIESECQERGIKISKNRAVMERKLIAALTVEFMQQHYRKV